MRKHIRMWALALAVLLIAAACGNGTSTTEAGDSTTTTGGGDATTTTGEGTTTPPEDDGDYTGIDGEEYEYLGRAEAGEYAGTSVEILSQWVDAENAAFSGTLADFAARTGINLITDGITNYEEVLVSRVEGNNPPDLAQVAQPGLVTSFADSGHLVALDDFMNLDQLAKDFSEAWLPLSQVDGTTYGVFFKADTKSIVWYPTQEFEAAGYAVPETWDELLALQEQIKADGSAPWCVGIESGNASGWVATDWMEDILLRTAPLDVYDRWITNELPFDAPEVVHAAEVLGELWFTEGNVYGGNVAINATSTADAPVPMFTEGGPDCWLHKQAGWIPGFFPGNVDVDPADWAVVPGEGASFFYFPEIDPAYGRPALGSGDQFVMFNDRPEVRAVIEYLATADAAKGWIAAGGFVSPNSAVDPALYTNYTSAEVARILSEATAVRFDASDLMPAQVGAGTFWSGMVEWISANGEGTEGILADIEASWPD